MSTLQQMLSALTALVLSLSAQVVPTSQLAQATGSEAFFVQAVSNANATGSNLGSLTTSPITTTSGNLFIVTVTWDNGQTSSVTVSDSKNNSYSVAVSKQLDTRHNQAMETFYAVNAIGGSSHVFSANFSPAASYVSINVHEVSGIAVSGSLDQTYHNEAKTGTNITLGPVTTTTDGEYIFCSISNDSGGNTFTANSPYIERSKTSGLITQTQDQVQTSAGSVSCGWTMSGTNDALAQMVSFKPSASQTLIAPSVSSFTASPSSITSGQSSTLSWSVSGNPTPTLTLNGSSVSGTSISVSPTQTTTYTLVATNSQGSTQSQTTVTVAPATAPTISSFSASPSSINQGESSTLSWSVSGTPTPTLSISSIGTVTGTSRSVSPTNTTTYTLTATNSAGSSNSNTTVSVIADTQSPTTPTNLTATAVSSSQINLSWTASTDNIAVAGYKIYRNGTQITTTSNTNYSDTSLSPTTTYSYTVSAYDAAGNNSSQSTSDSATTQAQQTGTYPWSNILSSDRAIDWSQAGIPGGIPSANWANCTTSSCNTLYGGTVTSASIRSALSSAPNNTVVRIPAGTYTISGNVYSNRSNVVLRGAGPTQTILNMGSSNIMFGIGSGGQGSIPGGDWSNCSVCSTKTLSTYAKESTYLTLSNTTGLSAGQVILIDQRNDTGYVNVNGNEGSEDAGRAESPLTFHGVNIRAQQQFTHIVSVDDATHITIAAPGLGHTLSAGLSPQVLYWPTNTQVNYNGIENVQINTGSSFAVSFPFCNYCWVKNIAVVSPSSVRSSIYFYWSYRDEVRDSYISQSNQPGAPTEYGIEMDESGLGKIENNIIYGVTSPTQIETSFGIVVGYNYVLNSSQGNQFPGLDFHRAHTYMSLMEGNVGSNATWDFVWGSASQNTAFRNRFSGRDPNKTNYFAAVKINAWNRYSNIIGNVLGTIGTHTAYECSPTYILNTDDTALYDIANLNTCGFGASGSDPTTLSSLVRWGNWDTVTYKANGNTNGVRWCTGSGAGNPACTGSETASSDPTFPGLASPSTTLPASFYLTSKPSWFGSVQWPAIGPDITCTTNCNTNTANHAAKIPAQLCYENGAKDSSGYLTAFDANSCYYSSGSPTTYTLTSTSGSNGSITPSGAISVSSGSSQSFTITPNTGYSVSSVTVDGSSVGAVTSYTFSNVTANHTISATFSQTTTPPSTTFSTNDRVYTNTTGVNIRNNPGTTGTTILGTHTTNDLGTIVSNSQNGTYADGYYWWNVNFDSGVDGWVAEPFLTKYTAPIVGDFNHDGLVNSIDLSLLTSAWNTSNSTYDLNSDGLVNSLDYTIMVQNWSV